MIKIYGNIVGQVIIIVLFQLLFKTTTTASGVVAYAIKTMHAFAWENQTAKLTVAV